MTMKRTGEWDDPTSGACRPGPRAAARAPSGRDDAAASSPRAGRRRWRPTTRCSSRRSSGRGSSRASPSTRSPRSSTRRRCTATSGSSGRSGKDGDGDAPGDRRRVQGPHPADVPRAARRGQGVGRARAPGRVRLLPGQRRRRRPRRVDRRVAHRRGGPLPLPAPAGRAVPVHRRLLPPGRVGRGRLRRLPHRHDGSAVSARRRPGCSPPTSTSATCCSTGSAWRWPRRSPSTGTSASARSGASSTRTARRSAGCSASSTAAGRYSWGYPACPDLEDNATVAELLGADRSASRSARRPAGSTSRSRRRRRSSATTRRPSTSSPGGSGLTGRDRWIAKGPASTTGCGPSGLLQDDRRDGPFFLGAFCLPLPPPFSDDANRRSPGSAARRWPCSGVMRTFFAARTGAPPWPRPVPAGLRPHRLRGRRALGSSSPPKHSYNTYLIYIYTHIITPQIPNNQYQHFILISLPIFPSHPPLSTFLSPPLLFPYT